MLEAVAKAIFEIPRVTPCAMSASPDYKQWLEASQLFLGLPPPAAVHTIFDPLLHEPHGHLMQLLELSTVGDAGDAFVTAMQHVEYLEREDAKGVKKRGLVRVIDDFFSDYDFDEGTRLRAVQEKMTK